MYAELYDDMSAIVNFYSFMNGIEKECKVYKYMNIFSFCFVGLENEEFMNSLRNEMVKIFKKESVIDTFQQDIGSFIGVYLDSKKISFVKWR